MDEWLVQMAELNRFYVKEEENVVVHPKKKTCFCKYHEIYLITDIKPEFIADADWEEGDEEPKKEWYNLGLHFYLPKAKKIIAVAVHNCWEVFRKPQQVKIVSWFKYYLSQHPELEGVFIPLGLKAASRLVGAPLGSMSHKDVQQIHANSAQYTTGFVYDEPKYQQLCLDVTAAILQAKFGDSYEVFFPSCSNKNLLAYECLVKTVNFLMGFALFTLREQGIRLIMKQSHKDFEYAAIQKMKGGIPMDCMTDFAVDDNCAYSFDMLESFDYFQMQETNSEVKGYCPGNEVLHFIKDLMLPRKEHTG